MPPYAVALLLRIAAPLQEPGDFVHFESPHVHPLDQTPDGRWLVAANSADARVELFALEDPARLITSIPVGLEPVSVRCESATRVWVVNHVSDSVSVVDLERCVVLATLLTEDEPCDVVFAGAPRRAYVSCSQANTVLVFDPAELRAAPQRIAIEGEEPRALAVSGDGATVYVVLFESGNRTTVLGGGSLFNLDFPPNVVGKRFGPWGGRNPPPNSTRDGGFEPPLSPGLPKPPAVGLIVRQDASGAWRDDFGGDWTLLVSGDQAGQSGRAAGWQLLDRDLAAIDTASGAVDYRGGLMNLCMALAVHPKSGAVTVVGTDAMNEIRFEPNLRGRFLEVRAAHVGSLASGAGTTTPLSTSLSLANLNPHLDRTRPRSFADVPAADRAASIGDPRAVTWQSDGARAFVAGMGSNSVVVLGPNGARDLDSAPIAVGEGPTGLMLDEARGRLYVLCKFESALSVIDLATLRELGRVPFFDPSPPVVRAGRRHLYDTRRHSAQGDVACGSCHVDARADRLAWDLGDPTGSLAPLHDVNRAADDPQLLASLVPGRGAFEPFHPMKGPMVTQSLQDVIGKEPLHWRGDRAGLGAFRDAFVTLQGGAAPPTADELAEFAGFLATIAYPPNPFRTLDDELPRALPLPGLVTTGRFGPAGQPLPPGDAVRGLERFRSGKLDNLRVDCIACHTLPTGLGPDARLVDGRFEPFAPTAAGERHHMLVAQDGNTNVTMKVPQLRGLHEKLGASWSTPTSRRGFGFLHDGSVDTLPRFLNEAQFSPTSDQETADLVAFLLSFPDGDPELLASGASEGVSAPLATRLASRPAAAEPPSSTARHLHAAIGRQVTISADVTAEEFTRARRLLALAEQGKVGLIAKSARAGQPCGWVFERDVTTTRDVKSTASTTGNATRGGFRADRSYGAAEQHPSLALSFSSLETLFATATAAAPITLTVVPLSAARRMGVDRDEDGVLDGDEPVDGTPDAAGRGER